MSDDNTSKMPAHVRASRELAKLERASGKTLERNKRKGRGHNSELYDVFKRINMHDGDKEACWEWSGAHGLGTRGEYRPRVVIGNKDYYVYRIVYELYTGYELQKGDVIRHQCDHCWCCNPHHMLVGSQADNVQDMLERERIGMKHFHISRIMQMLEIGATAEYVAVKMKEGYNMTLDVSVIRKIRMRTVYRHIPWEWGDKYAAERRARLNSIRRQRLASDPTSAIIVLDDNTTGVQDDDEDKAT